MEQGAVHEAAPTPLVSTVIVNYRTTGLLRDCLASLRTHAGDLALEVIVVDNATPSFEPASVTDVWPDALVLRNDTNVGFGAAVNAGAALATGDYLWLLNPDVRLHDGHGMAGVVQFLETHPEYAAASPLLVLADGTPQPAQIARFPTAWRTLVERPVRELAPRMPRLSRGFGRVSPAHLPVAERDVDHVAAAALLLRRRCFDAVGGFDPGYFMYFEDVDLLRRFAGQGWRTRWLPAARVEHAFGAATAGAAERRSLYWNGQRRYFERWSGPIGRAVLSLYRAVVMRWYARRERAL